jgi:hypothetical protein
MDLEIWALAEVFVAEFESVLTAIEAVKYVITTWYSPFLATSLRGHREHVSMSGDITIMKADLAKPVTSQLSLPARNWMNLWGYVKEKQVSLPFPRSGTIMCRVDPEDGGSILLRNVDINLQGCTVSERRTSRSDKSFPWKPENP